jgi:lysophospholipase L1-like esterase
LLARFDTDARLYRPDIAFITIGGNDSSPNIDLDASEFKRNLIELHRKFDECGCFVIFQTYYAPIKMELSEKVNADFEEYMGIVASVASETDSGLIDHLNLWVPLREKMPEKYLELMLDPFHVNAVGNIVFGLCVADEFGCPLIDPFFDEAESYRTLAVNLGMD